MFERRSQSLRSYDFNIFGVGNGEPRREKNARSVTMVQGTADGSLAWDNGSGHTEMAVISRL